MGNHILSAFADEYSASFDEQLLALQSFNIKNIELRHLNGKNISVLLERDIKEAKKMLDHYGISASAIGSPLGKISLDGNMSAHLEVARQIFSYANILGTDFIRIFSFYPPNGRSITDMRSQVFCALEAMLKLADEYGVVLCHENEAKIYGDIPCRCREIVDYFDGRIKCVFDMGNFVLEGVDPLSAYDTLKKDIAYFHIKDALYEGAIVPPGKGNAQIKAIIDAHSRYSKDDFFVSLEPHLQTFSGLNALVGRSFENPYKYENEKTAFADAVEKIKELI